MSVSDRVDRVDVSLVEHIQTGGTSSQDRRSLLAVNAALAARGNFTYLEIGSYHGASLQSFIADTRCTRITSINRREGVSRAERPVEPQYPGNTPARMREHLSQIPGANLEKLTTVDASTEVLDPAAFSADLCFIDAEDTNDDVLRDARFCRKAVGDRGTIVFHDRTLVGSAIQRFLAELKRYRAYPLSHDLFVVEIGVPSLLSDSRVRDQVPGPVWLWADRLRVTPLVLRLGSTVRIMRCMCGRLLLLLGAPRRRRRARSKGRSRSWCDSPAAVSDLEIHTFVNDHALYERMRRSFVEAGFGAHCFVRLSYSDDDPFAALTRLGQQSASRYPILCHQDVFPDQGIGAPELLAMLRHLEKLDPDWVVAGNAGVSRSGRPIRRLVDRFAGLSGETLPMPVVTLDENFLVLNRRNTPHCSEALSGFHLYGSDVCLHALASGGSAYVIDFRVTHLGRGEGGTTLRRALNDFVETWSKRYWFRYVPTTYGVVFISRSRILRRLFGSAGVLSCVRLRMFRLAQSRSCP